jgi:hypothetical protein
MEPNRSRDDSACSASTEQELRNRIIQLIADICSFLDHAELMQVADFVLSFRA